MHMAVPVYYTAQMVRALPADGNKYETVWGELLVTPAPRAWHQFVVQRIFTALQGYVAHQGIGEIVVLPADISWGEDILVQPDLFVVDADEARTLDWSRMKTIKLVVEVLSPPTSRYDRFTKRKLYQQVGIPMYWVVDAEQHVVEVWTPEMTLPTVERERVFWSPPEADEPLTLRLSDLFRPL